VTSEQAVAFFVFAVAAAGTPGPSNALLTATGASVGVARGIPALLGVAAGMAALMFVVAFGLGALLVQTPFLLTALKIGGAAVLCWLAWKIGTSPRPGGASGASPIGFFGAAGFQWINPKSWLVCASAAATFLDPRAGNPLEQAAGLSVTFVLACLPSCFPWLAFGAVLHRVLRSDRAWRIFSGAMGLLLAASVLLVVL
jgi:threonine/homoserine/homoserine lactone efflux protein